MALAGQPDGQPDGQADGQADGHADAGLADNPLLTMLGRRGRGSVVDAMRRAPARAWSVRDLARFADVDAMTASRCVKELAALGAVAVTRPGRDARVRWLPASPAAAWLSSLRPPDLQAASAAAFARAYGRPPGTLRLVLWRHPDDDPASPTAPVRIAILAGDAEEALEQAGRGLDAVAAKGLPAPVVEAFTRDELDPGDRVASAILGGRTIS